MTDGLEIHTGSDNVFRDLGFPEAEAQNLLLRADLVVHIRKVIDKLGVTQAEAAKRAGITQPRMNARPPHPALGAGPCLRSADGEPAAPAGQQTVISGDALSTQAAPTR